MICSSCTNKLLWGGDYDWSCTDGSEGIESNYTCINRECDVDSIIVYTKFNTE